MTLSGLFGLFGWLLLGTLLLASWAGAIILGGMLGGAQWAFGWGLMVYPWIALSAVLYWLAWRAARREEADGTLFLRRCLDCGRAVSDATVLCPDQACDGVDFGYQWDVHRRDTAYRAREEATFDAEARRERLRRQQEMGWIGNVTWRPVWAIMSWYMRGLFGRAGYATDTQQQLWWSSRLLAVGGIFAALVVNAAPGGASAPVTGGAVDVLLSWARMLMVLAVVFLLSAYIAINGPGSERVRLRQASRPAPAAPARASA